MPLERRLSNREVFNLSSRLRSFLVPLFAAAALLATAGAPAAQAGWSQGVCAPVTIRSSPSWSGAVIGNVIPAIKWVHNNFVGDWSYGWSYFYLYGNPNLFGQWWGYIHRSWGC